MLVEILSFVAKEHPPAPPVKATPKELSFHKNIDVKPEDVNYKTLDLRTVKAEERVEKL